MFRSFTIHKWVLTHEKREYRMAGKFGGNLIWRIGLQFHLADFNLAVLFSVSVDTQP